MAGGSSTHPFTLDCAGLPQRKAPRQGMTTPKETSPRALQVEESNMKDIRYWSYHPQTKTQQVQKKQEGKANIKMKTRQISKTNTKEILHK